eukprot:CAMPEP_0175128346 /NCGR_PEP_ID=MMETSP0087-20121206/4879_1 /TAXON_ID=136419 /ORGANISM="Unknown Unknown, Strain D1" /LENGTH=68 /DNA_ID=CAMNT_0016410401 /DNA_START=1 /DNA_END=207 /DNA_ORIENTATION=+
MMGAGVGGADELTITTAIQQREKARQDRNYALADQLRVSLKEMGVNIFDKEKRWTGPNGVSGVIPSWY